MTHEAHVIAACEMTAGSEAEVSAELGWLAEASRTESATTIARSRIIPPLRERTVRTITRTGQTS